MPDQQWWRPSTNCTHKFKFQQVAELKKEVRSSKKKYLKKFEEPKCDCSASHTVLFVLAPLHLTVSKFKLSEVLNWWKFFPCLRRREWVGEVGTFGAHFMYRRRAWVVIWDLCPRPVRWGNIMKGPVLKSFSYVKQSWDFSLFRNCNRLAGTFHRRRSACWNQVSSGTQGSWKYKGKIQAVLLRTSLLALAVEKKWAQFVASFPECPSQTTHPSPFTT